MFRLIGDLLWPGNECSGFMMLWRWARRLYAPTTRTVIYSTFIAHVALPADNVAKHLTAEEVLLNPPANLLQTVIVYATFQLTGFKL